MRDKGTNLDNEAVERPGGCMPTALPSGNQAPGKGEGIS